MRENIVAGNWKMNKTVAETEQLIDELKSKLPNLDDNTRVMIATSFVSLPAAVSATSGTKI